jgi:hypothetical protein
MDVATVVSNVAFLLPAAIAYFERHRPVRALIYVLMMFASGMYHMCDSFDACIFAFSFHHHLDFFFAQFLIVMSGLYVIEFDRDHRYLEYWLLILGGLAIVVLQAALPGVLLVQAGIVLLVFIGIVVFWLVRGVPPYSWDMLLIGVSLTAVSVVLFGFQNALFRDYWIIHSTWHVTAALGQAYLLRIKPPAHSEDIVAARRIHHHMGLRVKR